MAINLLYVEDNAFAVDLMKLYLRRYSEYKLFIETDGQSGWEHTLAHKPDVILVDINLPDMTGWDLTRKLRGHPETKHIPVIAITSVNSKRYHEMSMEAGINLHLHKGIHYTKILKHIDDLYNQMQV
jgi:two-component system, cell cycle response regulator DivK